MLVLLSLNLATQLFKKYEYQRYEMIYSRSDFRVTNNKRDEEVSEIIQILKNEIVKKAF